MQKELNVLFICLWHIKGWRGEDTPEPHKLMLCDLCVSCDALSDSAQVETITPAAARHVLPEAGKNQVLSGNE